jgi:hypothetical protein
MALLLYAFSDAPLTWPGIHGRYIIGLLIVAPAIFWPLWIGLRNAQVRFVGLFTRIVSAIALVGVCAVLIAGTVLAFAELPSIQARNQHDQTLINNLEHLGVKHIYTDYWTCNKIAFLSNDRVICGVVTGSLTPSHNRDPHYYDIVSTDPASSYVFPVDTGYNAPSDGSKRIPAVEQKLQSKGVKYRYLVQDGYIFYVPEV